MTDEVTAHAERPTQEDRIAFAESCCGSCPGATCYVDQMFAGLDS